MWKVAGVEVPEEVEGEPLVGLYVAGVMVSGGDRARGDGLREKLRDWRRDELELVLPLVTTLAMLFPFCRWGLRARSLASGLTVRMVLL